MNQPANYTMEEVETIPTPSGVSVRVSLGVTQNTGDFNSVRTNFDVTWTFDEEVDSGDVTDALYTFVEDKLVEKAGEVFDSLTGKAREKATIRPRK